MTIILALVMALVGGGRDQDAEVYGLLVIPDAKVARAIYTTPREGCTYLLMHNADGTVIAGEHPGVFDRLGGLRQGDRVYVLAQGEQYEYTVRDAYLDEPGRVLVDGVRSLVLVVNVEVLNRWWVIETH
jgi:sortase (surface protein transpeptidase)